MKVSSVIFIGRYFFSCLIFVGRLAILHFEFILNVDGIICGLSLLQAAISNLQDNLIDNLLYGQLRN